MAVSTDGATDVNSFRAIAGSRVPSRRPPLAAVLFDRDGTLIVDVPYNGDPGRVRLMPGARRAVEMVRLAGLSIGIVSNQSGVAKGLLTHGDVDRVNVRLQQLLGSVPVIEWCPHDDGDGCDCRKPAPGLIRRAAVRLGVDAAACVVIGDTEADWRAAQAAGAQGILVPNVATLPAEIARAPRIAGRVDLAVTRLLARERTR